MASRTVTVSELMVRAREMSDMQRTNFVTDDELVRYISNEYTELYDLMMTRYEHYFVSPIPYTIVQNGTDLYPLPPNFYKLSGVEKLVNAGPGISGGWQTMLPFNFQERNEVSTFNLYAQRYCLVGDDIMFRGNSLSQTVRIWYIPPPQEFNNIYTVSAIDVVTGTFTSVAHGMSNGDYVYFKGVHTPAGLLAGQKYFIVNATTDTFQVSLIEDDLPTSITSAGSGVLKVDWYGTSQTIDGVSGWEELIVTDVAIRMLEKEESSTTALTARRKELIKRIEAAAQSRDNGNCHSVTDTRSQATSAEWPLGWSF